MPNENNTSNITNMSKTNKKEKKPAATTPIFYNITIKAPNRSTSDISTWRSAMRAADMGRVKQMYDLFEDLLLDGVIGNAVDKRIEAVTNSELTFQDKSGKRVAEMEELIDTLAFENLLKGIMQRIFWGRSGVEFDFSNHFDVNILPPKHIYLPGGVILVQDTDVTGIPYLQDEQIIVLGQDRDYGLLVKAAPYAIYKRGGFGDYAQWLEIFGMPQRIGKYSAYDPQSRQLLENAMQRAGSAPWIVVPKETDVETTNNTGSGSSGISYNNFRQACNEEVLITISGQTLTTISGEKGARSLGEVHMESEGAKSKSDKRYTQRVLNERVRPILEARGIIPVGGKFIFPESQKELSVEEIISLSKVLPISQSYAQDKYGIPAPAKGEAVLGEKKEPEAPAEPPQDPEPPKKQKVKNFFVEAPAQIGALKRAWSNWLGRIRANSEETDVKKLVNRAIKDIYNIPAKQMELVNKDLFDITNTKLQVAIAQELLTVSDEEFVKQFQENTAVFSAFKNHQQTKEMVALLTDEKGSLRPFYQFKKMALRLSEDYNIRWLQTEYNTAVRAARMAANLKRFRETVDIYPNLEYIHTSAASPRERHLLYVGTILSMDHPWWETHMPPSDWNCQCSVRQTDKPETGVPDEDDNIAPSPTFENNPELTASIVKLEETAYYKNTAPLDRQPVVLAALSNLAEYAKKMLPIRYQGQNGGHVDIVKQRSNEYLKNLITFKILADRGHKYVMLKEVVGQKNPDGYNVTTKKFVDAKHPISPNVQNAIQRSISAGSKQRVAEVIIRLEHDVSSYELYRGLRVALQEGRARTVETIILIRKDREPLYFDVQKLREHFKKQRKP